MPTWLHFRMKFRPRCLQAALKTPLDAPAWRPRRPRSHPTGAQDAPRAAQELPQSRPGSDPQAPWGEDTPQSSPRPPPDLDFGACPWFVHTIVPCGILRPPWLGQLWQTNSRCEDGDLIFHIFKIGSRFSHLMNDLTKCGSCGLGHNFTTDCIG